MASANSDKLAVLVPVYNGGSLLGDSVSSCAGSGMRESDYEIIVCDNRSSDGAADKLPVRDAQGAEIQVHSNSVNIGRVGNWNRCVEIACEQGFRYVTFLFAGDRWLPASALPSLLRQVQREDAAIAFSPFIIADESGFEMRRSQRFYLTNRQTAVTDPRQFLSTLLDSGLFPLGPLQANIYSISREHYLRFDEATPSVTDVRATLDFILRSDRPIVIGSQPFLQWREHSQRFHSSMSVNQIIDDYFETFHIACKNSDIHANYGRGKLGVVLNSARLIAREAPLRKWPGLVNDLLRSSRQSPYPGSAIDLFELLWRRIAMGHRLLEIA